MVSAGYLSDKDIEGAADVLEDALIIADAENAKSAAIDDEEAQEYVIEQAEEWAYEDGAAGDYDSEAMDAVAVVIVDVWEVDPSGDDA